jgi:hypothetical protein
VAEFRTNISQWFGTMLVPAAVFSHPLPPQCAGRVAQMADVLACPESVRLWQTLAQLEIHGAQVV